MIAFFPCFLDASASWSARSSSVSASCPSHGKAARPPEIVSDPGASAPSLGNFFSPICRCTRFASTYTDSGGRLPRSRGPSGSSNTTANSSPPIRHTRSEGRTELFNARTTSIRISSPAGCP